MKNRTKRDKTDSLPQGIAAGFLTTAVGIALGGAILAYLIVNGSLQMDGIQYAGVVLLMLCVYLGGIIACRMTQIRFAFATMLHGLVVAAALIGIHLFFFEGQFENTIGVLLGICVGAVGSWLTAALPKKGRKKPRNR